MANIMLKAEQIVSAALGLLERAIVLPSLVWKDAGGDFAGAKNDTISLRLPAYANARQRTLRSGGSYTLDELAERKVDITLDTDVYKAIKISDEELTLDISNFGSQVLQPTVEAVARLMEDLVAAEFEGAPYAAQNTFTYASATDNLYKKLVDMRKALNDARVPLSERFLVCGSTVEADLLKSDFLSHVDQSGASAALRDASVGRIAGFNVLTVPVMDPALAFAFHRSAFVLSSKAPVVPSGVPFGSSASFAGLAMRVIRDYDFTNVQDRLLANCYMGSNYVPDDGFFNLDGYFEPSEGAISSADMDITTADTATENINFAAAHNLAVNDIIVFHTLVGGVGLTAGKRYYVKTVVDTDTITVSETIGGATVDITTAYTDGKARKNGIPLFVRAAKLTRTS